MVKLHELKPATGARKKRKRVGRGNASGHGTFSGRGCKGQNARAGGGVRIGFEGGQTPLLRRIPKLKGFKNPNREEYIVVNLAKVNEIYKDGEKVSPDTLREKMVTKKKGLIKILGQGELSKKLVFDGVAVSESARKKLEKAGATIENEVKAEKKEEKPAKKEKK